MNSGKTAETETRGTDPRDCTEAQPKKEAPARGIQKAKSEQLKESQELPVSQKAEEKRFECRSGIHLRLRLAI